MHNNIIYRAFLLVLMLVTLWYSGLAIYRYVNYTHLRARTQLTSAQWQVHEVAEDNFYLKVDYTFSANHKIYKGHTDWPREFYRNRWAAENDIPYYQKQRNFVWYNPSNPNHSSLQKSFPLKECISAAFLWGLLLYFLWIGFYINKFKQ